MEKARKAGILVITLDTPLDPVTAADANFATDNFKAGELIGQWAKATLGDKAKGAKIATLDLAANQPTVDYLRHNGFLTGFGIPVKDQKHFAMSDSPQIVGSDVTSGSTDGGRKAMEKILQKADHIDVVYAINEPAADGGSMRLSKPPARTRAFLNGRGRRRMPRRQDDQGWSHWRDLAAVSIVDGEADGVEAVAEYSQDRQGSPLVWTPARSLITDHPVPGVSSITTDEGMKLCWG